MKPFHLSELQLILNIVYRLILLTFAFSVIFPGCSNTEKSKKPRIVCSLFPLYEFARAVAGDRADTALILPPGVEPHSWEPKPSDFVAVSQADLFIYVHEVLEPWAANIVGSINRANLPDVLKVSEGLALLETSGETPGHKHHDQLYDPHIWLDLNHDQNIVKRISRSLSRIDPSHSAYYEKNAIAYNQALQAMDSQYQKALSNCRHHTFVFGGHSAFAYLAGRYGLRQVPLYGISSDSEPTPRRLAAIVEEAKDLGVEYIFFETMVNPKLATVIADEIGARTLVINPGANLTGKELAQGVTFLSIMARNLESLKKGLACE